MGRQRSGHQRHLEHMEAARARRLEGDRRQRVMVITEFDAGDPEATIHAMATETDQRAVQEGGPLKAATRQTASPG